MSQDRMGNEGLGLVILINLALLFVLFTYFDEAITIPWAAYRLIDSLFWSHVPFLPDSVTGAHKSIVHSLLALESWAQLEYKHVYRIEYMVMFKTTWLYLLLPLPFIKRVVQKKRDLEKYKKRLDYDELIEQETVLWRYNRYLIKHNPTKEGVDVFKGRFAGRETVLNGLKRTECFSVDRNNNRVTLNTKRATEIFSSQLKYPMSRIEDVYKLPFVYKFCICVFGLRDETLPSVFSQTEVLKAYGRLKWLRFARWALAMIPRADRLLVPLDQKIMHFAYGHYKSTTKIKHSLDFNEDVRFQLCGDYSYHLNGELDLRYVEELVNHILPLVLAHPPIQALFKQHAYAITFTRRLLAEARSLGKLGSSQFAFVKILDRQLWYALNDEGLSGSSFEATGVKAHYSWEVETKRAHIFPMMKQCFSYINGLNLPRTCDEYDVIEIPMEHPLATEYPFNPEKEKALHDERMKNDPSYRLQQTKIRRIVSET